MTRLELSTLPEFLAALHTRGVAAVAMQVVDEIRPRTDATGGVIVGRHRRIDLSAYDDGTVLALRLEDDAADPTTVERALRDASLTVRRRSANVS
ncbi:MAG: hypothetical protein JWN44_2766 [Myxococcales bacterium]|nr:hypothetical protein [Myxococcales bacterium]